METYGGDILDILSEHGVSGESDAIITQIETQETPLDMFNSFREIGVGYYLVKDIVLSPVNSYDNR